MTLSILGSTSLSRCDEFSVSAMLFCAVSVMVCAACLVCSASRPTSLATTPNPWPNVPARAASTEALSDSMLVCITSSLIDTMSSEMPCTASRLLLDAVLMELMAVPISPDS